MPFTTVKKCSNTFHMYMAACTSKKVISVSLDKKLVIAAAGCAAHKFESACNMIREICCGKSRRVDRNERVTNRCWCSCHKRFHHALSRVILPRLLVDSVAAGRDIEEAEAAQRRAASELAFRAHAAAPTEVRAANNGLFNVWPVANHFNCMSQAT